MSIISYATPKIEKGITSITEGRFSGEVGKLTRQLNKLAVREMKSDKMIYTFPKATPEDLKRLTSKSIKDSYKRVTWTNPKDNKVYHILEEGRKNGKVQVRILDKDGEFVKNAELTPKNIVILDNFFSIRGVSHGERMEIFMRRFNPFANVERLEHKKGLFEAIRYRGALPMHLELKQFQKLEQQMEKGKKIDYISVSEVHMVDAEAVAKKPGKEQQKYVAQSGHIVALKPIFEKILAKGTRILESAGNDYTYAKEIVNDRLAIEGVEGVGSLVKGSIAQDSCSRNSVFAQHYERRNFHANLSKDDNGKILGINITGLPGTDMPATWKSKKLVGLELGGTSYSTPIRVAKLSLNDMMQGVI